jgi:hypothetical protein
MQVYSDTRMYLQQILCLLMPMTFGRFQKRVVRLLNSVHLPESRSFQNFLPMAKIAFSGNYDGNADAYVIPTTGGGRSA